MEENKDSLASELLHEVKVSSKRWFILFIITLIMLFATNAMWLYAWNLPFEEIETTTVTQESETNGTNNYIGNDGDINGR